jgi:pimeloyl-ACP methyl ester carboxylesterase
VLAGAGFGAFNVRVYCGLYPREVAGVVLVDAVHEDQWNEERGGMSRVPFGLGYRNSSSTPIDFSGLRLESMSF